MNSVKVIFTLIWLLKAVPLYAVFGEDETLNADDEFNLNFTHFIVGGYRPKSLRLAKHAVSLRGGFRRRFFGDNHFCGGVIYSKNIILTAAHCTLIDGYAVEPSYISVVAGSPNRLKRTADTQIRKVRRIIRHVDFNTVTKENDIAKLILRDPLKLNAHAVTSLPLVIREPRKDTKCIVLGWGRLFYDGPMPAQLLYADVYTWSRARCRILVHSDNSMLCAGSKSEDVSDSCQGDSGGPLMCDGKLAGIVSFGFLCGMPNLPAFYANVYELKSWIENDNRQYMASKFFVLLCLLFSIIMCQ